MCELLGRIPKNFALSAKHASKFFDKQGFLKRIRGLNYWPLKKVLVEKYRIKEKEAFQLADFLNLALNWCPEKRSSAEELLDHPFLKMEANYEYKMTEKEYNDYMMRNKLKQQLSMPGDEVFDEGYNFTSNGKDMSELVESQVEMNDADSEGYCMDDHSFNDSESECSSPKSDSNKLNNSFTGPYTGMENKVFNDKGANPQFKAYLKNFNA
jgi:serine/threonine protein kinase